MGFVKQVTILSDSSYLDMEAISGVVVSTASVYLKLVKSSI